MRKILIFVLVVSLSIFIFAASGNAQKNIKKEEVITNATIIKMVKAKLGDIIILSKIKSGKTDFDLSTDAIIKLKELRVSDKVIEAMMSAESDSPPQTPAATVSTPPKVKSISPPQTQEAAVTTPPKGENVLPPQTQKAAPQIYTDIKTDKDSYNHGEKINVNFFNAPGVQRDWICIVPVGSPDNEAGDYKNMPEGLKQGSLIFESPSPGKYEVRAYYNYSSKGYVVSARYGFSVVGRVPSDNSEISSQTKQSESRQSTNRDVAVLNPQPSGTGSGRPEIVINSSKKAAVILEISNKMLDKGYTLIDESANKITFEKEAFQGSNQIAAYLFFGAGGNRWKLVFNFFSKGDNTIRVMVEVLLVIASSSGGNTVEARRQLYPEWQNFLNDLANK